MRHLSYSLAVAALLFLQCRPSAVSRPVSPGTAAAPETVSSPQAVDPEHSSLSSDTLRLGAPITLRLSEKHPEKLAITDADNRWYYIQDDESSRLMEPAAFAKAREIIIDAAQNGMFFEDGKPRTGPVFTKAGVYTIYLADNLETEEEATDAVKLNFWFAGKK